MNYYNEHDKFAAAWLRELIRQGCIPAGDVDERSIEDVRPNELSGYTQCHFFAGIGGWSYALDLAGWPRDMPIWTGSCPCQSFSTAGKGLGFEDERHLWPAWFHLIRECRPDVVFGEQVSAAIRHGWLDLVSADMEAEGYAVGERYWEHTASARRTSGSGFTSWPTPCQQDGPNGGPAQGADRLPGAAALTAWPTPRANDAEKRGEIAPDPRNGMASAAFIALPWATPSTRDHKDTGDLYTSMTRQDGKERNDTVPRQAFGMVANGESDRTEKRCSLNPALSRWIMGYPPEWCACAVTATPSVPKRQPRLSARGLKHRES